MARAIEITAGAVRARAELNDTNLVGRVVGDAKVFKAVRAGTRVTIRRSA